MRSSGETPQLSRARPNAGKLLSVHVDIRNATDIAKSHCQIRSTHAALKPMVSPHRRQRFNRGLSVSTGGLVLSTQFWNTYTQPNQKLPQAAWTVCM